MFNLIHFYVLADVSVADMTKRVQLEQWKTGMLRNLHMFISKTRLIVHNLPPEWNDAQLRTMVKKYGPPGAVIREVTYSFLFP